MRGFEVRAIGDLVGDDAELAADRVPHLARHHGDRDRHRVAGAQAAHDHVESIGKLRGEGLLAPAAQNAQHQIGQGEAAEQRNQQRLERNCRGGSSRCRNAITAPIAKKISELAEPDGQAGLQNQPIERLQRQPVIAAAGQAAFLRSCTRIFSRFGLSFSSFSRRLTFLRYEAPEKHSR